MSIEDRLKAMGIELPEAPAPLGLYVPCLQTGQLLYLSMLLPLKDGSLMATGKVGREVSTEHAGECVRQIVINALAIAKTHLGNLDKIGRCVRLTGYLATLEDFSEHPKVMNYASSLLNEVFGEDRGHTRGVIGVCSLPLNSPVALDIIFELNGTGTNKD